MALPDFCINDESQRNSHGFYLLNAGGRFARFRENPVMLDHHNLEKLIGKWGNLRVEGSQLLDTPIFDDGIELGAQRKGQVERGFLRGASPGIHIIRAEYRVDGEGKECLYVTEWELFEVSIVSVPSNAGAVTLKIYTRDGEIIADKDVKAHIDNIVKLCAASPENQPIIKPTSENMEKINLSAEASVALGIKQDATPEAIGAAIVALYAAKTAAETRAAELEAAATKERKIRAEALIDLSIKEGRIDATTRENFVQLAIANYDMAEKTLHAIPVKVSLAGSVTKLGGSSIPADRQGWTLLSWLKNDPAGLKKIESEDPAAYEAIRNVRN